jgi:V/A-type H+/Na+-transporting ATPase subunit E
MKENQIENLDGIISKLKQQGIEAGEAEKKHIIQQANEKAAKIIAEAEAQSRDLHDKAKAETAQMEKNAKAAIAQASRDLVEATKVAIINRLKGTFGKETEKLFTQEQYVAELLKVVLEAIPGKKQVEIAAPMAKKMEAYLVKTSIGDGVEIKPLAQSEAKISVKGNEKDGVNFVLTSKDVENAMFSLINSELVELITKSREE